MSISPGLSYSWAEVDYSYPGYETLCALKFTVNDNNWDAVTVTIASDAFGDAVQPVVREVTEWGDSQLTAVYGKNSVSFTIGGWEFRTHTYAVLLPPESMSSMVLSEDMVITQKFHVTQDVTVDLNGYAIRPSADYQDDVIFDVLNGTLTIMDSGAKSESREKTSLNPLSAHSASAVANGDGVTLTYYVTDPQITNSGTGATMETVYKHSVSVSGVITGSSGPLIRVSGGTVNIQGGMLYGGTGRAIEADSQSAVNLSGGYICGFQGGSGGAITVNGGSLRISGDVVVAGNHAVTTGGAISASGGSITMSGGIISGNTVADGNCSNGGSGSDSGLGTYGGGGFAVENCTVTLSGGYITNNQCLATGYWSGGGGIYTSGGSAITMSGGYITGNMANAGGGVKTRDYGGGTDTFEMTGGYICSNKTTYSEGGGIAIGAWDSAVISGGYINNNYADCRIDWGGGGVFVANDAKLQVISALVTDNSAGGFGGGVAGCSTARMYISSDSGAAIYDNSASGTNLSGSGSTKNADWSYAKNSSIFMNNGYQDLFCALNCTVGGSMLGGGLSNWQGSCDGMPVSTNSASDSIHSESVMGLTANPNSGAQAAAQAAAAVFVNGNYAYTHGGGILCNGYLVMGRSGNMVLGARIEILASKIYQDADGAAVAIPHDQFQFEIAREYADGSRSVVSAGTASSNGEIVFEARLPFSSEGTHIYYVYEKPGSVSGIDYDQTQYRITVQVSEISHESPFSGITATQCVIDELKVEKLKPGANSWEEVSGYNPDDSENGPIGLDLGNNTFINILREVPTEMSVTVNKIWSDPEDSVPVTVTLLRNGEAIEETVLSAENGWTHTWTQLPAADQGGLPYEYSAVESDLDEFDVSYSTGAGEDDGSTVITITNTRRVYDLEITKVSDHNVPRPLEGVRFRMLNSENEPLFFVKNQEGSYILSESAAAGAGTDLITDSEGRIRISGLMAGSYLVEETEALEGYQLAEAELITLGGETMKDNRVHTVTIVNKLMEYTLPETGGSGISHYITAGLVLVAAALFLLYIPKHFRRM